MKTARLGVLWVLGSASFPLLGWACSDGSAITDDDVGGSYGGGTGNVDNGTGGSSVNVPEGAGVGEPCSGGDDCRTGLECTDDVCVLGHGTPTGGACILSGECEDGNQCVGQICVAAGDGVAGDSCETDLDCSSGLRCAIVGFGAQCTPEGTGDIGATCVSSVDCFAGLACGPNEDGDSVCNPVPPGFPSFGTPWEGVDCDARSKGSVRAYFEVPGAPDADEGDFFRLPFPNDVRLKGGKPDLSGFPTPGTALIGIDAVKLYVDALEASGDHWGAYPSVTFRFSGGVDLKSFQGSDAVKPIRWTDVTEGTPEFGNSEALHWFASTGRGHYVCSDWLSVRPATGGALRPGHTYAVWLTTDGKDDNKKSIERSENLVSVLGGSAPSNATLKAAYDAYAPFRAYLTSDGVEADTVLNAAVFTVGGVRDVMHDLADAVAAAPAPTASGWVQCGGGVDSPCPTAESDACHGGAADFDEYQALVSLPIFQKGTAPYLESGGGIDTSGPVRNEDVCLSLTVPKGGAMPTNGWPLVIFAHGTGGSFRSHVADDTAGTLSNVSTNDGDVAFAVLGIDQVEHAGRRGDSDESPDNLFFNFLNPAAARGNPLQGAADQLSLARLGSALSLTAQESGGDALAIDPDKIVYWGHSQGATEGSLMIPYAPNIKAAVLSGNGASLMHALLTKTSPVNIAGGLPFALSDFDSDLTLFGGEFHPVLSLLQQWIDPADPLNFARVAGWETDAGTTPKSIFQPYGLGDTYSPPLTLDTYAIAAGLTEITADSSADPADELKTNTADAPICGNHTVDTTDVTLAVRQYGPPSNRDGHFVAFDVATANQDVARFLAEAVLGVPPQAGDGACP